MLAQRRIVVSDFQLEMETKKYLGVDPGDARCGVAISDDLAMLAHPLETIDVRKGDPVARVAAIVNERSIAGVVVGVPRAIWTAPSAPPPKNPVSLSKR